MTGPVVLRLAGAAALLAAWIGAALLAAAVVAPAAFAVLPTRALAGALVGRVLPAVFVSGAVVGIAAALLAWSSGGAFARARVTLSAAVAVACLVAQLVITPRIARLRETIGPSIEALDRSDPRRVEFGRLHGYSVAWMGAGMLAAGATLVLTLIAARDR
ncbi:MAG: DUF4149 domain-containing protein [Gemmatirosa sp.]|nr:DUF4149 domain-containing protein [Gemmatirosa sp.]